MAIDSTKPTLNTVNPDLYSVYEPQDSTTRIQWGAIGKAAQGVFDGIEKDKKDKKDQLDKDSDAIFKTIAEIELNADKTFDDVVLGMATNVKKNLLMQQQFVRDGLITPDKFRRLQQNAKNQMAEFGIMAKSAQEYTDASVIRQQDNTAGASETYVQGSNQGFGNMNGLVEYIDPGSNMAYMVRLDKDGKMPSYKDSPESFLPASYVNNRSKYQFNRENADIQTQTAAFKVNMQKYITSFASTKEVNGMEGVYMVEIEDVRRNVQGFKDMKEQLFQSSYNYDDEVLSNAAAQFDGRFKFAQSLKEFKETNPGVDEKYFIKVDANSFPPKFTPNDRAFAESVVREASDDAFDMQMDEMVKIKGGMTFPQASAATTSNNAAVSKDIGYLERANQIATGDLSRFSGSSAESIIDMNRGQTDPALMIDAITRQGDVINITYQNGRVEPVPRRDSSGKIRSTTEIARELFQLISPSNASYDDTLKEYNDAGRSLNVNVRDKTDAEIKNLLETNAAKLILSDARRVETDTRIAEINADTQLNDAQKTAAIADVEEKAKDVVPTSTEINDAIRDNNIDLTADVAQAKLDGSVELQTYTGEDAVGYASRDPLKVKASGQAIIKSAGSTAAGYDMTGTEEFNLINPGSTTLPRYLTFPKTNRKDALDGPLDKVLKAYLPSSLRGKVKISLGLDSQKIEVTVGGKKITVFDVTDKELGPSTSFVDIDKYVAMIASQIIGERNNELSNRRGGKPSAY